MVLECPEVYDTITKPLYIDQIDRENENKWIQNYIDGPNDANKDEVLYSDEDFVLVKGKLQNLVKDKSTLHCLAFLKRKDLLSIRDLTLSDVPLLK